MLNSKYFPWGLCREDSRVQLQEETLLKFYEALNPGGFLVLDMVESLVGEALNAFENIDNRLRIYRRPADPSLQFGRAWILSQEKVDEIVDKMPGKRRSYEEKNIDH